jgi:DNA invertase Pin-like site-specific DNA recombinase
VVGSAPVKNPSKSAEAAARGPLSQNPYGAKARAGAAVMPELIDESIIPAVDRLSRDTADLLVIARDLRKAGAGLRSTAEPVVDATSDFAELVLAMLGVAAKLERRRIKERTALGRASAKARGVEFGRKPKLTEHQRQERSSCARKATRRCPRSRSPTMSRTRRFRGLSHERRASYRVDPARNMRSSWNLF